MTNELVIPLRLAASRRELAGGKAASLGVCLAAGLPVVQGFVVTVKAFQRSLEAGRLDRMGVSLVTVEEGIHRLTMPDDVRSQIELALEQLISKWCKGSNPVSFAVRSSTPEEDGATHSFAGQFESYLCVRREQIPEKIVAVWASAFTKRAATYRKERGVVQPPKAPAVLVQPMIDADSSGVAFSTDPVTGQSCVAVVSGTRGLGLKLVSGEAPSDTWRVSREGTIVERVIANKPTSYRIAQPPMHTQEKSKAVGDQTRAETVDRGVPDKAKAGDLIEIVNVPAEAALPSLSDRQVAALARMAWQCEDIFKCPQDIEWAVEGDRLWLLQARPITSLVNKQNSEAFTTLWDNSNIAESYSGITTPLTFSFARHAYSHVYRQFCRLLCVSENKIEASKDAFDGMLGFIFGRIYYNLKNWHRVLAMLPGYVFNAQFMEQMMGVRKPLPEKYRPSSTSPSHFLARAFDFLGLLRSLAALCCEFVFFNRSISKFQARFNKALNLGAVPLERLDTHELLDCYRDLEKQLLQRWDAPIVNDFFAMIFFGLLNRVCEKWLPEEKGTLAARLIATDTPSAGAEPVRLIQKMGAMLSGHEEILSRWRAGLSEAVNEAANVPGLEEALTTYLERFGDRCFNELKLETPSLREEPAPLLRAVANAADVECRGVRGSEVLNAKKSDERHVLNRIRHSVVRVLILKWLLEKTRFHLRIREELRLERTRLFGRVRRIFLLIGRRLEASGCLRSAEDVFFLTLEEVIGAVNGTGVSSELAALTSLRRSEYLRNQAAEPPPDRFETQGAVCEAHIRNCHLDDQPSVSFVTQSDANGTADIVTDKTPPIDAEHRDLLRGIGCSPGKVRALARVVLDPAVDTFQRGEILVARHTDPGWVLLFPSAAGILVERGSLLSHAAIVARELGLPAVVGVDHLLEKIHSGDLIEMDGEKGLIVLLDKSQHS